MGEQAVDERMIRRVAAAAIVATTIEWYDFFIYGTAAALVFPTVFFASTLTPFVALLIAFSTFAVGFIARPIGGIVFGHFGDRIGRKKALVIALILMASATTLIGLLPTYAVAGQLAPIALVLLRFAQGLALGGQWGGATLLVTESAPKNKRGFYASVAQAGSSTGTILANLIFLFISSEFSEHAFMTWGWRVPFLLSIVLIPFAIYIELRLEDTPAFEKLKELNAQKGTDGPKNTTSQATIDKNCGAVDNKRRFRWPVVEAIRTYPKQIAIAAGTVVGIQVTFYVVNAFAVAYATNPGSGLNISRNLMLGAVLAGGLFLLAGIFTSGMASDRLGRKPVLLTGAVMAGIWAFAFFPLIQTASPFWIFIAVGGAQLFQGLVYGAQGAFATELFSTKVRYSGASLAIQGGAILGGGLAPMIATALYAKFHTTFAVSLYVAGACLITTVSVAMAEETYKRDLDHIG